MPFNTPWKNHKFQPHPWQAEALEEAIKSLLDKEDTRSVIRAATGTGKSFVQVEIAYTLYPSLSSNERIILSVPKQALVDQMFEDLNKRMPGKVRKWYQYERKLDRPIIVACHASMMNGAPRCLACHPPTAKEIARRTRKKIPYIPLEGTALKLAIPVLRCEHLHAYVYDLDENCLGAKMLQKGLSVKYWIADEIHQTECMRILAWASLAKPDRRVGFTATPYRTSESQHITLFEEQVYHYGIDEATRDGVIVRPRFVSYDGTHGDINFQTLEMIQDAEGPGIVNAWDIEDAEMYANFLSEKGFPAMAIHSKLSKGEQKVRLRALKRGRLRALVHVNLLSEGRNFPWLRWICLRRSSLRYDEDGNVAYATMSRTRFAQEVGRVLRTYRDRAFGVKTEAVIYDPNNLRDSLELSYEELLGLPPDFAVSAYVERAQNLLTPPEDVPPDCVPLVDLLSMRNPTVRWLTKTSHWLKAEGHAPWTPRNNMGRREPLIEQYERLHTASVGMAQVKLPPVIAEGVRKGVRAAIRRKLTRTQLEDLVFIMEAVGRLKGWPET